MRRQKCKCSLRVELRLLSRIEIHCHHNLCHLLIEIYLPLGGAAINNDDLIVPCLTHPYCPRNLQIIVRLQVVELPDIALICAYLL